MVVKLRCVLLFGIVGMCYVFAEDPTSFFDPNFKTYNKGSILERHFDDFDILDGAMLEAWRLAGNKEYSKAHEVLETAIKKLYVDYDVPRYVEEAAIDENYMGLLIAADSALSFAQGKTKEAFEKFYSANTLVSYSLFIYPAFSGETIDPGFWWFSQRRSKEDILSMFFGLARSYCPNGKPAISQFYRLSANVADFGFYFTEDGKCFDKKIFEFDLKWYLENIEGIVDLVTITYKEDSDVSNLFLSTVAKKYGKYGVDTETGDYFGIRVTLEIPHAYELIKKHYDVSGS